MDFYDRIHGKVNLTQDSIVQSITRIVASKIYNQDTAYGFVLEEIEAAHQGNDEAKDFAQNSGFLKGEYDGAMANSSIEIDGVNGPQQTLLRSITELPFSMEKKVQVRINVVKKIIELWFSASDTEEPLDLFEEPESWVDELISWARLNNLPNRPHIEENPDEWWDTSYSCGVEGFPQDENELIRLSELDRYVRGSIYDNYLVVINLNNCKISALPSTFHKLLGIHTLYLHDCGLEALPKGFFLLRNIDCLDLGKNKLKVIPCEINNLSKLKTLNLHGNDLRRLPDSIIYLRNLERLNISDNKNLILTSDQQSWINLMISEGVEVEV